MGVLLWIVFGALVGWIASLVMNTDEQQGALMNIVLGIIGAFVGGWIFQAFGAQGVSGFNIYSLIVATIGAIAVIAIARYVLR